WMASRSSSRSSRPTTRRSSPGSGSSSPGGKRVCKDCGNRRRDAKYPGPRCWTCHRAHRAERSAARKAKHVETRFRIREEVYQTLLFAQDGRCYICRRKPGKKRLAVDHDHQRAELHDHPKDEGCPECIRGLLCRSCNRYVLGHLRDSVEALLRAVWYLIHPPARNVLAKLRGEN